ncbi:hypothetical protein RE2895_62350 (plasmid) [Rhodococcus erythropolis]|nr:hypothetical protein RE2895_61930 [Rhodococcus erythropolis]BBE49304.1 hypothetical protein RE2895_62350 [Rhodococcus erythropolis]
MGDVVVGVGPERALRGRPVTGHDLAATRSGRLLIKPPKQDRTGVATTTEWTNPGQCTTKEQSDS